jgi:tyrosyl-tRNA synthetase
MWRYYPLLTSLAPAAVAAMREDVAGGALHPKAAKVDLATRIVADFHGTDEAARAAAAFEGRFSRRELPSDLRIVELTDEEWRSPLEKRLVQAGLAESSSDARRKIAQGGVKINGEKVSPGAPVPAESYTLQAGKLGAVRVTRKA